MIMTTMPPHNVLSINKNLLYQVNLLKPWRGQTQHFSEILLKVALNTITPLKTLEQNTSIENIFMYALWGTKFDL
jgi:hypothetical protein